MSNNDVEHGGDPACWAHLTPNHNLPSPLDDAALAELVRNLSDGVIVANADGVIVFWNSGAERIFGWKQHEALGQTLDLIIPERQRAAHWTGYVQTTVTGHTRYGTELLRVPALHRNGQRRSIAFTVTLLGSTDTKILIAAVIRDETQRWAEEQDLRRQARDHNARSADT